MMRRLVLVLVLFLGMAACAGANTGTTPIVILISVDGWRWDYLERFTPPTLTRLAAEGVRAEGLIPQFPSTTFPNHYTIVTGLRPARHGIVSNNMVAPDVPGRFSMSNRDVLADPRWWGGDPIWNAAERQGLIAAPMFWPGSETTIGGRQATLWIPFNDEMTRAARVDQILEWLRLPDGKRPSFLTLYFSDVDSTGHTMGPDSGEVREAALGVDRSLRDLIDGVEAAGLTDQVHYIVVSDHGMAPLSPDRVIVLDDYIDLATADILDRSPVLALSPNDGDVDRLYAALKDKHPSMAVYRGHEIPAVYGLAGHPRAPAVVGIADEGWHIATRREIERWTEPGRHPPGGAHGYDARLKSMQGLFIAAGPRLLAGAVVPPFENIHIYHLMCAILGVEPAANDGDPAVTRAMLR